MSPGRVVSTQIYRADAHGRSAVAETAMVFGLVTWFRYVTSRLQVGGPQEFRRTTLRENRVRHYEPCSARWSLVVINTARSMVRHKFSSRRLSYLPYSVYTAD